MNRLLSALTSPVRKGSIAKKEEESSSTLELPQVICYDSTVAENCDESTIEEVGEEAAGVFKLAEEEMQEEQFDIFPEENSQEEQGEDPIGESQDQQRGDQNPGSSSSETDSDFVPSVFVTMVCWFGVFLNLLETVAESYYNWLPAIYDIFCLRLEHFSWKSS